MKVAPHTCMNPSRRNLLLAAAGAALCPTGAFAEKYPARPIDLIVPWGVGGGADQLARRVSKILHSDGISLVVHNVPGATGTTGTARLLASPPDGYTMGLFIADTLGTLAGGKGRFKINELLPLGVMIRQATGLFVKHDSKWKTFDDLLADAKVKDDLRVAITGFSSPDEIHVNKINDLGAKLRSVPFAAPAERYLSILGGHADVLVEQAGDVRDYLDQKQMRPILFFADQPQVGYESIALAKSYGINFNLNQFRAVVMRAGTDPAIVTAMSNILDKVAKSDDFRKYLGEELAFNDSYIPASGSASFIKQQFALIEANTKKV